MLETIAIAKAEFNEDSLRVIAICQLLGFVWLLVGSIILFFAVSANPDRPLITWLGGNAILAW